MDIEGDGLLRGRWTPNTMALTRTQSMQVKWKDLWNWYRWHIRGIWFKPQPCASAVTRFFSSVCVFSSSLTECLVIRSTPSVSTSTSQFVFKYMTLDCSVEGNYCPSFIMACGNYIYSQHIFLCCQVISCVLSTTSDLLCPVNHNLWTLCLEISLQKSRK